MLYFLIITDDKSSYDNYSDDFYIGIFRSKIQANRIARFYLNHIKGFYQFSCSYRIISKKIVSNNYTISPDIVYIIQGWNINANGDEIDIVESDCLLSEEDVIQELEKMKKYYQRQEWTYNWYFVGGLEWKEGFDEF